MKTMSCIDAVSLPCECSCLLSLSRQYKKGPQESSSGTASVGLADITWYHCTWWNFPGIPSTSFVYWQPSNSGGNEALRTRLLVSEQSFLWVHPHYVSMFNKALLHKHFPVTAYFSKLLAHFNTLVCIVKGIIIYVTWTTLSLWDVNILVYTVSFQGPTQFSVACGCGEMDYMLHIASVNNSVNEFYCLCACSVFYIIMMCVCLLSVQICQESALHERINTCTRNTICWMLLSNKLLNLDNRLHGTVMSVVLEVTFSKYNGSGTRGNVQQIGVAWPSICPSSLSPWLPLVNGAIVYQLPTSSERISFEGQLY